jgi:hypothetical protein
MPADELVTRQTSKCLRHDVLFRAREPGQLLSFSLGLLDMATEVFVPAHDVSPQTVQPDKLSSWAAR